jgi:cation diffusion facilitator CzcD-associated flavoprotein CzcO
MKHPDAIIVGAGPAGLACAASLGALGLSAIVLEKADTVGSVWRRHYDRLHLHTDRGHSGLPGLAMPRGYPTYPSRAEVVEYSAELCDALPHSTCLQHHRAQDRT